MLVSRLISAFLGVLAFGLAACAADDGPTRTINNYYEGGQAGSGPTDVPEQIRIWVQPHPLLTNDAVIGGCRAWWSTRKVDCVLTDMSDADFRITVLTPADVKPETPLEVANLANCVPDAEGKVVLAQAWFEERNIVFYPKCLDRGPDMAGATIWDVLAAKTVVTHEVGHLLGLPHVPLMCDASALTAANGDQLCGYAVMNPLINLLYASAPTLLDQEWYEVFAAQLQLPSPALGCEYKR